MKLTPWQQHILDEVQAANGNMAEVAKKLGTSRENIRKTVNRAMRRSKTERFKRKSGPKPKKKGEAEDLSPT